MNPIDKLKELEQAATPGPWELNNAMGLFVIAEDGEPICSLNSVCGVCDDRAEIHELNADLMAQLRNIAPELIALWEAASKMDVVSGEIMDSHGFWDRLDELNAKAAEVLK